MTQIKDTIKTILPERERTKNLLNDLEKKKMTLTEFNKECAYWLISYDLYPKMPPTRPQKMFNYDRMTYNERNGVPAKFWHQGEISSYLDQSQRVKGENEGMLAKLKEFKEYIPEGDTITRTKYDRAIQDYL